MTFEPLLLVPLFSSFILHVPCLFLPPRRLKPRPPLGFLDVRLTFTRGDSSFTTHRTTLVYTTRRRHLSFYLNFPEVFSSIYYE